MLTDRKVLRLDFAKMHTVYKNQAGVKVPGVTTVLGMLNKPALLAWAWNEGVAGRKLDHARQVAADIGTVAHGLCEAHLRGMTLDPENITPEVLGKAETSYLNFLAWWDSQGLEAVATELPMVSEVLQVGGTADIVAQRPNGDLLLVDLKTGKAIYDEMYVQVATYAAMWEEMFAPAGKPISQCFIVRIPKDETDQLEVKEVLQRPERVAAFAALAQARTLLKKAGVKV